MTGGELDFVQLILHASLPVQLVMLLLLLASIASWVIIFRKKRMLDRAEKEADRFEERFWSGADLGKLYAAASERNRDVEGLESIFEAGFREYSRSGKRRGADSRAQLEGAQRGMRVASSRELDGLEHNLEFLANVGSIAPYVGLLGTVWGIMIASKPGPCQGGHHRQRRAGISEALIATAMGLFARSGVWPTTASPQVERWRPLRRLSADSRRSWSASRPRGRSMSVRAVAASAASSRKRSTRSLHRRDLVLLIIFMGPRR